MDDDLGYPYFGKPPYVKKTMKKEHHDPARFCISLHLYVQRGCYFIVCSSIWINTFRRPECSAGTLAPSPLGYGACPVAQSRPTDACHVKSSCGIGLDRPCRQSLSAQTTQITSKYHLKNSNTAMLYVRKMHVLYFTMLVTIMFTFLPCQPCTIQDLVNS